MLGWLSAAQARIVLTVVFHALIAVALVVLARGVESLVKFGFYSHKGAELYYDAVHGSRHLWNRDNRRHRVAYHTVSGFNRFYRALEEEGFDIHAETYKRFNRSRLDGYDVFFVGEQTYHARFMSERERKELIDWVHDGGGLFAIAEHTNAHYMAETFNSLFEDLPIKANMDSIGDMNQPGPISPTWIDIPKVKPHPVTEGVDEYRFYNGCSFTTPHGVLFSARSSWSDDYDPTSRPIQNGNKRKDPGEKSGPHAAAAAFEHGQGRVVVVGDHNAMSNPTMYWGDHYRFVMNSMKWLAGKRLNADLFWALGAIVLAAAVVVVRRKRFAELPVTRYSLGVCVVVAAAVLAGQIAARLPSYDFFVHTGNTSDMKYMTKRQLGYFSLYGQWTKEPQLKPWASRQLEAGYDGLVLSAPTEEYTAEQLEVIDGYLGRGRTVAYLATVKSLESEAGKQLQEHYGFKVEVKEHDFNGRKPVNVRGPRWWTESIFRFYIYPDTPSVTVEGLEPVVHLTRGGYHIGERQWRSTKHWFDVISEKDVKGGSFVLVTPVEMFNDRSLKNLYTDADVVRQQMAELIIRLGKYVAGDTTEYYVD
jgi:hypothetical protein